MSRDASVRLDKALVQFPALKVRLEAAPVISREMGALSISRKLRRVCSEKVALVGDASGSVDAITGEGLCLAFKQALSLAAALKMGSLAAYQSGHRAISRRPDCMARLMLMLDKHSGFQRRALAGLARHPSVFAWMLSTHVGQMRLSGAFSLPLGQFCLAFLEG
jgi:flavin-dependent dehydrogenase